MSAYNPSIYYNAKGEKKTVASAEEAATLGKEWFDSPKKAAKHAPKAEAK